MPSKFSHLTAMGLCSLAFILVPSLAQADSLLVGTSFTGTIPTAVLCPQASNCNNRLSEFSSSQDFTVSDVKVQLSGPAESDFTTDGNFSVSIVTDPGTGSASTVAVGSGTLPFSSSSPDGSVSQIFDFSGLSIDLTAGTDYYLEVTGANLLWNTRGEVLPGSGTLGSQLSCDAGTPNSQCARPVDGYDRNDAVYAEQISGNATGTVPGVTPEPSSLILLATGVLTGGVTVRKRFWSVRQS